MWTDYDELLAKYERCLEIVQDLMKKNKSLELELSKALRELETYQDDLK